METIKNLIETIIFIFKIIINFKEDVANLYKYLIVETIFQMQLVIFIIIVFTLFFVVRIIKSRKKKNIKNLHIYFLIILLILSILLYLKFFNIMSITEIIELSGVMTTAFFSASALILNKSALKLSADLAENQNKKEIKEKFSLPCIGTVGIIYNEFNDVTFCISIKDDNENFMYKYKMTNLMATIDEEKYFFATDRDNSDWKTLRKIIINNRDVKDFFKTLNNELTSIMYYRVTEPQAEKLGKSLKKIKESDPCQITLTFTLEVENIYQIITKIDTCSFFKCSSNNDDEMHLENMNSYFNNYELSYNEIKE